MASKEEDELREKIEHMFRSTFQDGEAIALNRKSSDGSPWKIRIEEFTDLSIALIQDHTAKEVEKLKNRLKSSQTFYVGPDYGPIVPLKGETIELIPKRDIDDAFAWFELSNASQTNKGKQSNKEGTR